MADRLTQLTIRQIQSDGVCFVGGAKWRGRQVMRVSVTSWPTDEEQGRIAVDANQRRLAGCSPWRMLTS